MTDGVTNASLPKADSPDEATLEYALALLQARAEKGPSNASFPPPRREEDSGAEEGRGKEDARPQEGGEEEGQEGGAKDRPRSKDAAA